MRRFPLLPALLLLALWPPVRAQEGEPEKPAAEAAPASKPAEMDETSRKLLEAWEKRIYHPGRLGVKKASHNIKAKVDFGGMAMEGGASYRWDGAKGSIEWDNPQLGGMLSQQGWSLSAFDAPFKPQPVIEFLAGAKVTAVEDGCAEDEPAAEEAEDDPEGMEMEDEEETEADEGGATVLKVEGIENGPTQFVFDADGVLKSLTMKAPGPMGAPMVLTISFTYTEIAGKLARASWVVDIPSIGLRETTKFTYTEIGGFHLPVKAEASSVMQGMGGGKKSIVYTDWKLNDDVK